MLIYLFSFAISFFFIYQYYNTQKIKYYILSFMPLFVLSAFRYGIGTDYFARYVPDYSIVAQGGVPYHLEYGFIFFEKILSFFVGNNPDSYWILFFFTSLIFIAFVGMSIKRSNNIPLSLFLFLFGGFYFGSMNIIRQYIAISIVLYFSKYIFQKSYIKFYFGLLLALCFHNMAFIYIILPLLAHLKLDNKKTTIVFFVSILLMFALPNILEVILPLTPFYMYLGTDYLIGDFQTSLALLNIIILMMFMYVRRNQQRKLRYSISKSVNIEDFYFNIQVIACLFYISGASIYIFDRIAIFFSLFQILSIPHYLNFLPENKKKKICILIMALYILVFIWLFVLNNTNEVVPYQSIFFRG